MPVGEKLSITFTLGKLQPEMKRAVRKVVKTKKII